MCLPPARGNTHAYATLACLPQTKQCKRGLCCKRFQLHGGLSEQREWQLMVC